MLSITTIKAREKFAKAHAEGLPVPKVTQVGWGTGGVDVNSIVIPPKNTQTIVEGEFLRKPITSVTYPNKDKGDYKSIKYTMTISPNDEGALGKEVSSCGLYDETGDLIAVKNFGKKLIDADTTDIEVSWIETF